MNKKVGIISLTMFLLLVLLIGVPAYRTSSGLITIHFNNIQDSYEIGINGTETKVNVIATGLRTRKKKKRIFKESPFVVQIRESLTEEGSLQLIHIGLKQYKSSAKICKYTNQTWRLKIVTKNPKSKKKYKVRIGDLCRKLADPLLYNFVPRTSLEREDFLQNQNEPNLITRSSALPSASTSPEVDPEPSSSPSSAPTSLPTSYPTTTPTPTPTPTPSPTPVLGVCAKHAVEGSASANSTATRFVRSETLHPREEEGEGTTLESINQLYETLDPETQQKVAKYVFAAIVESFSDDVVEGIFQKEFLNKFQQNHPGMHKVVKGIFKVTVNIIADNILRNAEDSVGVDGDNALFNTNREKNDWGIMLSFSIPLEDLRKIPAVIFGKKDKTEEKLHKRLKNFVKKHGSISVFNSTPDAEIAKELAKKVIAEYKMDIRGCTKEGGGSEIQVSIDDSFVRSSGYDGPGEKIASSEGLRERPKFRFPFSRQ